MRYTGRVSRLASITSWRLPRCSSSRVRSSTIETSGRRCSTSWPYHSGVEYDHHDSTRAFGSSAVNASSSHRWTQSVALVRTRQRRGSRCAGRDSSASPTPRATMTRGDSSARRRRGDGRATASTRIRRRSACASSGSASGSSRHHRVHDAPPRIAEPRPGEEHRPEVVAIDRRRSRRMAAKTKVVSSRDAREQRVPRDGGMAATRNPDGTRSTSGPNWAHGEVDDVVDLARHVGQRPVTAPWNWRARTTSQNPLHVSGCP